MSVVHYKTRKADRTHDGGTDDKIAKTTRKQDEHPSGSLSQNRRCTRKLSGRVKVKKTES